MKTPLMLIGTLAICAASIAFAQQSAPAAERRMQHHQERFTAADTDKDNHLSKAEAEKATPRLFKHFDKVDTNKDARLSPEELQAMAGKMRQGHRSHRHHHGMFGGADANRDRVVTREELVQHQQKTLQNFEVADANRDGKLVKDEMKALRDKLRAEHRAQLAAPAAVK